MKHYALHLLWACQNACSYCWVEQSVRTRPEQYKRRTRPMEDWAAAIKRDRVDVAELLGGEPLLIPWLSDLIAECPETKFAISTNGLKADAAVNLAQRMLPNIISINVSLHPESEEHAPDYLDKWSRSVLALREMYNVCVNVVDAPLNREKCAHVAAWLADRRIPCIVSPYEQVRDLGTKTNLGLCCRGGIDHLLVAPDGEAWPCFTALRSPYYAEYSLGNWLDDTIDVSRKAEPCYLQCVDYYVLPHEHIAGDMWGVKAKPCES